MLKQKYSRKIAIFRKKTNSKFGINLQTGVLYKKKQITINLLKFIKWVKVVSKRFRKRRLYLFINFKNNLARTYKSKNIRMGKGKGQNKLYMSMHKKVNIGFVKNTSPILLRKLTYQFVKYII